MLTPSIQIQALPPLQDIETAKVLKALTNAHRHLGELKGRAASIPNETILINTLTLQEALASSEIENIVTTQDELFQADQFNSDKTSPATKEVSRYRDALRTGFQHQRDNQGLITNRLLIKMFQTLKETDGGFRVTPGTTLKNERTGELIFVPPQDANEIVAHMNDLETFINDSESSELDPLVKMALIHHQFETIHPFPDGNGRIGRILNVLYLTKTDLLDTPILYLSRAITQEKENYYNLLQHVRDSGEWEDWLLFMINAVATTAQSTVKLTDEIQKLMAGYKDTLRQDFARIYSQDLLNNLFSHPYTRIEYLSDELGITRQTAATRLDALAKASLVKKVTSGRNNYYINEPLVQLFMNMSRNI